MARKDREESGVKKTESGLLYKVTNPGDESMMPKDARDVVKVQYTGRTRDGKVFRQLDLQEPAQGGSGDAQAADARFVRQNEPVEFRSTA